GAALSDSDRAAIEGTLPLENDTVGESQQKINTLKQQALEQLKLFIQTRRAGHFDTRDLEAQYLSLKKQLQPVVDQKVATGEWNQGKASMMAKSQDQQPKKASSDWWIPPGT